MFMDEVDILLSAGKGGDGAVSFRREKYVPRGGPDGGNGGSGGSIYLQADEGMTTLSHFRYKKKYSAENGANGEGGKRTGKKGRDLYLSVPVGTLVRQGKDRPILFDLNSNGETVLVAKGGRGGRGNSEFAGPTHQTPRFAEKGDRGEEISLRLELKLLADVGLVGYPNAGKSTFLSVVSAARPKIASYPFTTLFPNLGVVEIGEDSFVVADLPGLIDGASQGVGLGDRFLRHIERTRLLLHLVDLSGLDGWDPLDSFERINTELGEYDQSLSTKPQIVVGTKMDLPESRDAWGRFSQTLREKGYEVYPISAPTGEGVRTLLKRIREYLKALPRPGKMVAALDEELIEKPIGESFRVIREEEGVFRLEGEWLTRKVRRFDLNQEEAVSRLQNLFSRLGVDEALLEAGAKEGDSVRVDDYEFFFLTS